jgi:hypothetical protein
VGFAGEPDETNTNTIDVDAYLQRTGDAAPPGHRGSVGSISSSDDRLTTIDIGFIGALGDIQRLCPSISNSGINDPELPAAIVGLRVVQ